MGIAASAAVGAALFVVTSVLASARRGYPAVGGEAVFLLAPLWWLLVKSVLDQAREDREERRRHGRSS